MGCDFDLANFKTKQDATSFVDALLEFQLSMSNFTVHLIHFKFGVNCFVESFFVCFCFSVASQQLKQNIAHSISVRDPHLVKIVPVCVCVFEVGFDWPAVRWSTPVGAQSAQDGTD